MLIGIFNPMGAQSDRLRCEVCQNLFLSPMNTGFLDTLLQQCLPFTVLKQVKILGLILELYVATVLTVYGIETHFSSYNTTYLVVCCNSAYRLRY